MLKYAASRSFWNRFCYLQVILVWFWRGRRETTSNPCPMDPCFFMHALSCVGPYCIIYGKRTPNSVRLYPTEIGAKTTSKNFRPRLHQEVPHPLVARYNPFSVLLHHDSYHKLICTSPLLLRRRFIHHAPRTTGCPNRYYLHYYEVAHRSSAAIYNATTRDAVQKIKKITVCLEECAGHKQTPDPSCCW